MKEIDFSFVYSLAFFYGAFILLFHISFWLLIWEKNTKIISLSQTASVSHTSSIRI